MPRPKRYRKMNHPPVIQGFRPFGSPAVLKEAVKLLFEEYEAIKLADYENLSQEEAAGRMDVSRPTFTRIYEKARRKIARAFAETRSIVIEGGYVQFDREWYRCVSCESTFVVKDHDKEVHQCPVCTSEDVVHINAGIGKEGKHEQEKELPRPRGDTGFCMCPSCGLKLSHQRGVPCRSVECPECGEFMMREIAGLGNQHRHQHQNQTKNKQDKEDSDQFERE